MNDKLKEELEKTPYSKPKFSVLLGWIIAILSIAFFFFVIPPFSPSERSKTVTMPKVREFVRVELNKEWTDPISPPSGKCVWYETVRNVEHMKTTGQRLVNGEWEFWDANTQYPWDTNRFRATYEFSYLHYEIRTREQCIQGVKLAPKSEITVRHELKGHWSHPIDLEKGTCVKWWGADSTYRVQISRAKFGSENWVDWEPGMNFHRFRFGAPRGETATVFWQLRPAGQCRD
ncbi:hypothetical protein [Elongatibacter sediminis]|uniref:Uncharacterized protein n=1 Tax=Elongatibacter sediminis TaxID=3119006 RepID=A0AAW9RHA2_9GAMM